MAHFQPSRYGAPSRPHNDNRDSPNEPTYSYEYGGNTGSNGSEHGVSNRRRPQQYQDGHEPHDISGHTQRSRNAQHEGHYGYNDGYENDDRRQREDKSYFQQSRHRPPEQQWNDYEDPRRRGPLDGKPQVPASSDYPSRRQQTGSSGYGKPQDYQPPHNPAQHYQSGSLNNRNDGYVYEESYWDLQPPPPSQHFDRQPQESYTQSSQNNYHQAGRANGRAQEATFDNHLEADNQVHDTPTVSSKSPKPAKIGPAGDKGNGNGKKHVARPKRILDELKSPQTLSWDNPFPTFPTKPKKSPQTESSSLHISTARTSLDETTSQQKTSEIGPQTAPSKDSHDSPYHSKSSVFERYSDDKTGFKAPEPASTSESQHDGYVEQYTQTSSEPYNNEKELQGTPRTRENSHSRSRVEQLRPLPSVQGRNSEDNRARPFIPPNSPPISNYERSKTMPAAISGNVVDSGLIPTEDHSSWQEPGCVAGYFGPEDKGFLPVGQDNGPQQRPYIPLRSRSDEDRWSNKIAVRSTPKIISAHPYAVTESVGDIVSPYRGEAPRQRQPYPQNNQRTIPSPVEDEMPNFDVAVNTGGRRRGMTIDDHLEPQPRAQEFLPPLPTHSDPYEQSNPYHDEHAGGELPRSRSQPAFGGGRPPRAQQNQGFDFGLPVTGERRPATSAAPNDYGSFNSRPPMMQSPDAWRAQDPRSRPHNGPGPRTVWEGRAHDGHRGPDPRRIGHEPMQSDRHHLPAAQNRPPNDRMGYGHMQPNQLRSPPIQNGRPARDRMGHETAQSDRHRSPPVHNGRRPSDRMWQPGGRPSPTTPKDPLSPFNNFKPNPDALPHHPAPVRPGLANGQHPNQAPHPAPVRQYNGAPDPVQQPGRSRSTEGKDASGPVTHQQLEVLKQKTLRSPSDQASQLQLAKKLVEASTDLVDERADPNTKKRNRDKYNSDALKIIKKLSASGYPDADFYYADCHSRGALGLQSDIKEAFTLYQRAAKANHPQAAYRVAVCCEIGQEEGGGTKRDPVKAMQWYKRAATLGDVAAMYKMGVIQLKGLLGQPKDPREAVTWLTRAAERADKENPHALHELALLHEKPLNLDGVKHDEARSCDLFTQAANLGYKFSQFRLGCAYEYGLLRCPVDPRQSIAWYSKAAVQEEHQSELALSGWYLTGSEGVLQQSDTEAYLWARKAAQAGLSKAEYAMGYFTEVGIGAPANLEDAKRWYWRSASQNFPKARDRLEDLRKGGATKQKTRVSRSNMKKQSDGECTVM